MVIITNWVPTPCMMLPVHGKASGRSPYTEPSGPKYMDSSDLGKWVESTVK